jgi:hypothetical protein
MGFIRDLFFGKEEPKVVQTDIKNSTTKVVQFGYNFSLIEKEVRGKDYVLYGPDNLFPEHLHKLIEQSPTQKSIIKTKTGFMQGKGMLVNDAKNEEESKAIIEKLTPQQRADWEKFEEMAEEALPYLCRDWQMYGAMALNVVWDMDFTRINLFKHESVKNLRAGKIAQNDDVFQYRKVKSCEYYYSRDWCNVKHYPEFAIQSFDEFRPVEENNSYNQIMYEFQGDHEYYGELSYSTNFAELEQQLSVFSLSSIKNSFQPGQHIQIFGQYTPEQQDEIERGLSRQFEGANKANRFMLSFALNKDTAPVVTPVPTSDIDKMYQAQNAYCIQNILTANQVTSPLLFGLTTPSGLSAGSEMATAYAIMNNDYIEKDRKRVECMLNKILKINGLPLEIKIEPNELDDLGIVTNMKEESSNPVVSALSNMPDNVAQAALNAMTPDEIRALVGLPPTGTAGNTAAPIGTIPATPEIEQASVNENVKNLTAKQHQQILRILRQYGKQQISKEVATTLLRAGLGFSDEEINTMLGEE